MIRTHRDHNKSREEYFEKGKGEGKEKKGEKKHSALAQSQGLTTSIFKKFLIDEKTEKPPNEGDRSW